LTEERIESSDAKLTGCEGNTGVEGLWYDKGVSAWKVPLFERPGFRSMWQKMAPGDLIVMLSFDRGWRSVQDFLHCYKEFANHGIEVAFVRGSIGFGGTSDSPMTRFVLTGEANIAELKSELISERVRESWNERRKRGLIASGSTADCVEAAETGIVDQKVVRPIKYQIEGNSWGEAYRLLRDQRKDAVISTGRVFGYARVSTVDQSPVSQRNIVDAAIQKFCGETGWSQQHTFVDHGISAYRSTWSERPEGKKLWAQFQTGDHVFILCADRAYRSIGDMSNSMKDLENRGVTLHFIRDGIRTDQGSGVRLLQSLSLAAQWEWEDMSSRIRLSQQSRRERSGIWCYPKVPRWMAKVDGAHPGGIQLLPDHYELDRMIQIQDMVSNRGKTTWPKLADEVEAAMAERDGRIPIPHNGANMQWCRKRSTVDQRKALSKMIRRKTMSLTPVSSNQGWKRTDEMHPEISVWWLKRWKKEVWGKLIDYVSVKPEIFGDARDRLLEAN
jgi:DNA invertase Pin-like site-specific DNA recombinase